MAAAHDRRLSRVQLKEAYALAEGLGLDTGAFRVAEVQGSEGCLVHEFKHSETRSFFRFDWAVRYRTGFYFEWWPSHDGKNPAESADSWPEAKAIFARWLVVVNEEIATPDVWMIAGHQRQWLTSTESAFSGNTPFTKLERETIAHHLHTIEEFAIKTYELQAAEAAHVRERLGYLTEAASRVGRFDWKNLAASTFMEVVLTLGLDVDKAHKLLDLATQLLGPLVVGVARLLSP
jgi:hypothetical protein